MLFPFTRLDFFNTSDLGKVAPEIQKAESRITHYESRDRTVELGQLNRKQAEASENQANCSNERHNQDDGQDQRGEPQQEPMPSGAIPFHSSVTAAFLRDSGFVIRNS